MVIILWSSVLSNTASSQQLESRINNLESDFRRLQLQLNQIELKIVQNRQTQSPKITLTPPHSTGSTRELSPSEVNKMLNKLAILVVELKEQVNQLTMRVTKLEPQ
ncbi:hypothetical protein VB711_22100 [Cronbergia sp. UHCC 0137]|uniref:hypothetical protein n=1 Tax=Cronbergia sp. UHCC 0137 TaxID=3110239 RepID=UPI002B1EC797|nr:hypothetical protein [Cronbergia sp. UHCC 0137]MEA5620511.1 hypothetical protein [Cronbergia sp. UHCC 0137]